ncbi:hypothetical protein [Paenibacillus sp. GXUN7292]|uniref:hypothetical protein n=1 Tax=Paenibacillus sp. GXUN7292 TaxID=3422499 RepID=UPI003D7C955D
MHGLWIRHDKDDRTRLVLQGIPGYSGIDEQFNEEMNRNRHLSVANSIDYWSDAIHSDYSLEPPFTYIQEPGERKGQ